MRSAFRPNGTADLRDQQDTWLHNSFSYIIAESPKGPNRDPPTHTKPRPPAGSGRHRSQFRHRCLTSQQSSASGNCRRPDQTPQPRPRGGRHLHTSFRHHARLNLDRHGRGHERRVHDDNDAQLDVSARRNHGGFEPLGESARQRPDAGLARKSSFAQSAGGSNKRNHRLMGTLCHGTGPAGDFPSPPPAGSPETSNPGLLILYTTRLAAQLPNCHTPITKEVDRKCRPRESWGIIADAHGNTARSSRPVKSVDGVPASSTPVDSCR